MKRLMIVTLILTSGLAGCGVEEAIRRNDDRYARPGAMDSPLTGIYNTYQFGLLDRYRVTHQWTQSSCSVTGVERRTTDINIRGRYFNELRIYEVSGKTWTSTGLADKNPYDFDRYIRSVISEEKFYTDAYGKRQSHPSKEIGFQPLCYESWWTSSHSLSLRLHKLSMAEFEAMFSKRYPEGKWSSQVLNSRPWRVQETSVENLRPRRGVGGPYRTWATAIGDTGYVMALEMTASQDSMKLPEAHAAIEEVYLHLIKSVRIEPLTR